MYNNIVFIGGVHGVGKGTICQAIKEKLDFIHLSASDVLKWENFADEKRDKKVENISVTQQQLIENLKKIVIPQKRYLLDGHFCLFKKDNSIERIALEIFQEIDPLAVILIKEKPNTICDRLQKRDGKIYSISQIETMQIEEIESAKELSACLGIQLLEISIEDIDRVIAFLQNQQFPNYAE